MLLRGIDFFRAHKTLKNIIDGVTVTEKQSDDTGTRITASSNFGNMFSVVLSSVLLPFLPCGGSLTNGAMSKQNTVWLE
jgi:hypothetical protein